MSTPFLKLHVDKSHNSKKFKLTSEVKMNHSNAQQVQGQELLVKQEEKLYTLIDLFAMDPNDIDNNVYQIIEPIELRNQ